MPLESQTLAVIHRTTVMPEVEQASLAVQDEKSNQRALHHFSSFVNELHG